MDMHILYYVYCIVCMYVYAVTSSKVKTEGVSRYQKVLTCPVAAVIVRLRLKTEKKNRRRVSGKFEASNS